MDYRQRWGFSRPAIVPLYDWFSAHENDYRAFLEVMRTQAPALREMPRHLDSRNAQGMAWEGYTQQLIDQSRHFVITFCEKFQDSGLCCCGHGVQFQLYDRTMCANGLFCAGDRVH